LGTQLAGFSGRFLSTTTQSESGASMEGSAVAIEVGLEEGEALADGEELTEGDALAEGDALGDAELLGIAEALD
jgi:hypothetical protein